MTKRGLLVFLTGVFLFGFGVGLLLFQLGRAADTYSACRRAGGAADVCAVTGKP